MITRAQNDPRHTQIAILCGLLLYQQTQLSGSQHLAYLGIFVFGAVILQGLFTLLFRIPRFDPRSPLISSLSLCLLARCDSYLFAGLLVVITIGSKFLIRIQNAHVFNPTNLGIVALLLLSDQVWIAPGQWGSGILLAGLLASLGLLVGSQTARSDVPLIFLGTYSGGLFLLALYLGDPWSIPFRRLQSGSLLIFTFFMISDPKTIPNARAARIAFASGVALLALLLQYNWIDPLTNGLFYALTLGSLSVPLFNHFFKATPYQWKPNSGPHHEKTTPRLTPAAQH